MRDRRRGRTDRRAVLVVVAALLLAACGTEDPEGVAVATSEPEEVAEEEPEEEPEEPEEHDEDTDVASEDGDDATQESAEGDGESDDAVEEEPAALGACDLATTQGGTPVDADEYERLTLEANFELELLVADMAADLDELLSGVSDGPTLEGQLDEHREAYAAAVEPLRDVAPPDGAEEWHERAMASFDDVCTAIEDGLAGSEKGEDERFEAFVEALTEFPSLGNGLHANAACGPFESC